MGSSSVKTGDNLIEMGQSVDDEGVNGKWLCEDWMERIMILMCYLCDFTIKFSYNLLDKLLGDRRNVKVMGAAYNEKAKIYTLNEALELAG